ncbi:hypothetical protein Naga_100783g1 [Nannochloropsis gaditana]|uniref:Uncharacterized protein n=1 Tax=Nannochloropsis gaditana TaxID=72520 RepID=W7T867_9STRA|nr:hypothetical protein Naga_100783g1 [Nannochloropsis gaditana]
MLDEATSSLDAESEHKVQEACDRGEDGCGDRPPAVYRAKRGQDRGHGRRRHQEHGHTRGAYETLGHIPSAHSTSDRLLRLSVPLAISSRVSWSSNRAVFAISRTSAFFDAHVISRIVSCHISCNIQDQI